jgi:hypothetical protein
MDAAERRVMLVDSGVRFTVAAGVGNQLYAHFYCPEDIRGRIEGER